MASRHEPLSLRAAVQDPAMIYTSLRYEVADGVAIITYDRQERRNAWSLGMFREVFHAVEAANADETVGAIVLTNDGPIFCSGTDFKDGPHEKDPVTGIRPNMAIESMASDRSWLHLMAASKPVIAAVNGACAGIGLCLAAACDIRFARREATFVAAFARRGLTAEAGLAWTLPRIIGWGAASDMMLSGRKVSAEEAREMRLVNAVFDPAELMNHAMAYAANMATDVSPRSTRIIKQQLRASAQQTFQDAMLRAFGETLASMGSSDFREGMASFKERRSSRFTGQ